jgi:hypothetical protein
MSWRATILSFSLIFLLPPFFSATNTIKPLLILSQINLPLYKSNHPNTQFVSISVLIQILLIILCFKWAKPPVFLLELNFKLLLVIVYFYTICFFCLGVYLFYSFFFIEICCMNVWFVHVRVCLKFYKIIFVGKLMKCNLNFWLRCFVMK